MLIVLLTFILFAIFFIYLVPTFRSKILATLYMLVILFFIWGIGGLVFAGNPTANERYLLSAFYIFILGIHIPLLIKLTQITHRKDSIKAARSILGSDVKHLTDVQLQHRLKH